MSVRAWNAIALRPDHVTFALAIWLLGTRLTVGVVVYGQHALNHYGDRREGRRLGYHVGVGKWLVLVLGGLSVVYDLLLSLELLSVSFLLAS
ncbi:MAG: hypothetical protein NZ761_04865 [Dehalococcoidia bacterium]|nr:hypothetical protein [Dehalococcoidia bacterium]